MHPSGARDYDPPVKFTCEKCGRTYVADEKVRGRAFRMKCKQCGHQIVVKPASIPTPPPGTIPAITPLPFFLGPPLPGEEEVVAGDGPVELEPQDSPAQMLEGIERSSPAGAGPAPSLAPPPLPPRVPQPHGPPVLTPVATRSPFAPPRPALELEDSSRAAEPDPFATMAAELSAELASVPEAPPLAPPDPFLTPAAPPPPQVAPKLSESEEAFADLSRMMDGTAGSRPLSVQGGTVEQRRAPRPVLIEETVRPTPVPARPTRRWAPIVGLGFGFGTIIAVGWLLASSDPVKKLAEPDRPAVTAVAVAQEPAPRPPAPAPRAPEPAAAPVPAPAPAPAPAPVVRAPEPEIAVPRPAKQPTERAPPAEKRAARARKESPPPRKESPPRKVAEARPAAPPPAPAPTPAPLQRTSPPPAAPALAAPARASSPPAVAPAPATSNTDRPLDEKDIETTIGRHAKAFEGCVAQARKAEPQLLSDQRRVTVTMTVNPNGRALYPTLDDQELSTTGLGACLKREAGRMSFPEFAGEPVRVRVPLVLR